MWTLLPPIQEIVNTRRKPWNKNFNISTGRFTRDGDAQSIAPEHVYVVFDPSKSVTLILESNVQSLKWCLCSQAE
jgi:hypothetical protein